MTMPSPEFCQLVRSLAAAQFAAECGAKHHEHHDELMATAEADLMSWAAHRASEIDTLRWAINGDHG